MPTIAACTRRWAARRWSAGGSPASFDALFHEPFYQLMRQQFLAHEMELAHELGADLASWLHIAPAHNHHFTAVTSPALQPLGSSPTEIWARLVRADGRFRSVSTESLFGRFPVAAFPELVDWWACLTARYGWLTKWSRRPASPCTGSSPPRDGDSPVSLG